MTRSIAFEELLDLYDVFLIDQFGVLRDHVSAYDGAPAALSRLKEAEKTVLLVSN